MRMIDDPNIKLKFVEAEARLHPSDPVALAKSRDPRNIARFKNEKGEWRDADWPTRLIILICRTPGCLVENVAYEVNAPENVDGVIRSQCGRCDKPHQDVAIRADLSDSVPAR